MKVSRRKFLMVAGAATALIAVPRVALGRTYPSQPVRWLVGFPTGGHGDISTRLIAGWLTRRLGQPFVVENEPGAASNVATEIVARAPADGYTLLAVGPPAAINPSLYERLNFDFMRDIAPVASFYRVPNVMAVNFAFPAASVLEFIAYAKANPGAIKFASGGEGTSLHVSGELFKMMAGVDIVHAPYPGAGPALADLLVEKVQVIFAPAPAVMRHIRDGKLRALGVTTTARSQALPDTPAVSDFVPGFESSSWQGVGAPKQTPQAILDTLNKEINAALADPVILAQLIDLGAILQTGTPAEFGRLIAEETEKWAKVIKFAGIKRQG